MISSRGIVFVILSVVVLCNGEEVKREGREFHGYLPQQEEGKNPDYQIFPYPPPNHLYKDDYNCGVNPMISILGKGLNLLLLKLGVLGITKAVMALMFVGFLAKLPLLLLKMAAIKSFFFPFLIAPLLLPLLTSQMAQSGEGSSSQDKPGETPIEMPGMQAMDEMTMGIGRQLNDNLTSVAWESMKMFAESDQCLEKISCLIGASGRDSAVGYVFSRMMKYLHYTSPPSVQEKITKVREAFSKGSKTSTCSPEDFKCHSPELMLQHGMRKIKIL